MTAADDLARLRAELGDIDRELLGLIAARQATARAIGLAKQRQGLPTRDFRQERDVVERARQAAELAQLPAALGEELALLLIRHSLATQEQHRVADQGAGGGKHALVIGGAGHMGKWFARFLMASGYAITIADPALAQAQPPQVPAGDQPDAAWRCVADWSALELEFDLIVVATPMGVANEILLALAKAPPRGLIFDIASLKSPLRSGLAALAQAGGKVVSLHPMFGPDTQLLSGRHVIVVDVGVAEASRQAEALFAATMATVVTMDLDRHDRYMAYVLGLSHALNIAFFTALAQSGESAPHLAKLSSTTFDHQMDVAHRVAVENPDLYFDIQCLNDFGSDALTALTSAVDKLRATVTNADRQGFRALMADGRAYFQHRALLR